MKGWSREEVFYVVGRCAGLVVGACLASVFSFFGVISKGIGGNNFNQFVPSQTAMDQVEENFIIPVDEESVEDEDGDFGATIKMFPDDEGYYYTLTLNADFDKGDVYASDIRELINAMIQSAEKLEELYDSMVDQDEQGW